MGPVFRVTLSAIFLSIVAAAQPQPLPNAVPNDNRSASGKLQNGVLTLKLELRMARWAPDADDGPTLKVPVFAEEGRAPQVPGPLIRIPAGTEIHLSVRNLLSEKATVHGLHPHPSDRDDAFELQPNAVREFTFSPGVPGTYPYYGIADPQVKKLEDRWYHDGALGGAFIVDPAGAVAPDRVLVISLLTTRATPIMDEHEVLAINGKAWPYTERVTLTEGEPAHWRVVNPTPAPHPMHLHGSYFTVLGVGNANSYTRYEEADRRTVVTELVPPGGTFDLQWTPRTPGRWLFHCHFLLHMSAESAIPRVLGEAAHTSHQPPELAAASPDRSQMGGLVLEIEVKPRSNAKPPVPSATVKPRHLQLILTKTKASEQQPSTIQCAIRELASDKKLAGAPGPPLLLTRGEPVEIEVVNGLGEPTSIHWHGIELDSYYDGVPGVGGSSRQVTPAIPPGQSFVAKMAPPRAGTFIYHTHWGHETQLTGGLYGALVVVEPGQKYDAESERIFVIGSGDIGFETSDVLLNGARRNASAVTLERGKTYRFRFINIAADLNATVGLSAGEKPLQWRIVAKDGWELPERQRRLAPARQLLSVGETYDFEFTASEAGEYQLVAKSEFTSDPNAKVTAVVRVK